MLTPGLPEQGSEHDPTARSSHEPELPIAESWQPPDSWGPWPQGPDDPHQGWDPGDGDGPPGLEEDDDAADTVDYRSDESDDDEEPDSHTFFEELISQEEFLKAIEEDTIAGGTSRLRAYLNEHGTQVEQAPIEALDVQNGANECWSSTEPDMYHLSTSGASALTEPVEVQLSPQMSMLLMPTDGETLPELRHADEYYVVRVYPSGVKRTVVEREQNIISREEALKHEKQCNQAMLDELKRWLNLGAFERVSKKHAGNVIDARWVLKWKVVNSERIIQARLVVRGFKDLQAAQLSTFAGTTTRWGQRLVNSVAAQHGWPLFTADVSQAFLRGLTFDQAAQLKDEVHRDVQFTVPPGSVNILKRLPGYQDFNPLTEVLRMLRCGFGLKDAPRLWNKVLRKVLQDLGLTPLQSDPQLYVWHASHGSSGASALTNSVASKRLVLILSTHVDDFKGAGESEYRQKLIAGLEKEFSTLKIKTGNFECVGVMHEQDPSTFEVWTHQHHYVPQIKEIPVDAKALVPDEEPADEDLSQLFMSLVGALAWLILTMPSICIYVAYLQRQTKAPNLGHIRRANRLLRWIRRNIKRLGVYFQRLRTPVCVVTLSDSAFKAQDYQGLVMRGCVNLLAEDAST